MTTRSRYFGFQCRAATAFATGERYEMHANIDCTPTEIVDGLLMPDANRSLPDPDQIEAAVLAAARVLEMAVAHPEDDVLQTAAHTLRRLSGLAVSGQVAA